MSTGRGSETIRARQLSPPDNNEEAVWMGEYLVELEEGGNIFFDDDEEPRVRYAARHEGRVLFEVLLFRGGAVSMTSSWHLPTCRTSIQAWD